MKKRKIQLVTGSRGEWGYIRPIIRLIEKNPHLDYELVVTNMHLLPEFGYSIEEIEKDNVRISDVVHMALGGFNNVTMTKSLAVFLSSYAEILNRTRPDLVLLAGDRGEQFMAAIAAAHMNIPVAHIQAGELSGNIDGAVRHAITKMAHLHFSATRDAYRRVIRMGEQKFRCFCSGAPQLDDFLSAGHDSTTETRKRYRLSEYEPFILLLQHSVTQETGDAYKQMAATLRAIRRTRMKCIAVWPNNDAGTLGIKDAIHELCDANFIMEKNVPRAVYGGLLASAEVLVGNSSSGLLEAPSFKLPAVNIGSRQAGRERGINVIDASHREEDIYRAIQKALSPRFRNQMKRCVNPYGDGKGSERIVKVLEEIKIDQKLLLKTLTY